MAMNLVSPKKLGDLSESPVRGSKTWLI